MSLSVQTLDRRSTVLATEDIDRLSASIRGRVITAATPGYDEARTIWNAMIDRRPALIVQCATPDDVVRAVALARERSLLVAVRGGGHNIAGHALCDDGLVIDLSPMKRVQIDPIARTAQVEAGVLLGEFDAEAQKHGLVTPLGINSTTGVAGLTLGGGFGWLSKKLGLTIDNLLSAEVVTAAGERVHASESEHPQLFWAIRGGGGNFGIVTSFEYRLHQVGPQVLSGLIVHPLDDAKRVLQYYREFSQQAPDEFSCWFVLRQAPPVPFLPTEWHGREVLVLAVCYAGSVEEGERVLKPFRAFGNPIADVVGPQPYTAWQQALDPLLCAGQRNYWKSHDFRDVSDGFIDVLIDFARRIPDPQTDIACAQLGGAVGRVSHEATAYTHRDANYVMNVHGRWGDPAADERCIAWTRALFKAAEPYATGGAYVNFLTQEEGDRVQAAYGPNYDRLLAVKNQYDPTNLFRMNQNIRPATTRATV
jgi:FAD/FMN-containing dehydrogenase